MGNPGAVQGFLDPTVSSLDDLGGNGADKGIKRVRTNGVYHAFADFLRVKTSRRKALSQNRFVIGPDLRPAHILRAVASAARDVGLTGPGHNTETPTLVPFNSCSNASDNDRTAYLLIEYGPWFVPLRF